MSKQATDLPLPFSGTGQLSWDFRRFLLALWSIAQVSHSCGSSQSKTGNPMHAYKH